MLTFLAGAVVGISLLIGVVAVLAYRVGPFVPPPWGR